MIEPFSAQDDIAELRSRIDAVERLLVAIVVTLPADFDPLATDATGDDYDPDLVDILDQQ